MAELTDVNEDKPVEDTTPSTSDDKPTPSVDMLLKRLDKLEKDNNRKEDIITGFHTKERERKDADKITDEAARIARNDHEGVIKDRNTEIDQLKAKLADFDAKETERNTRLEADFKVIYESLGEDQQKLVEKTAGLPWNTRIEIARSYVTEDPDRPGRVGFQRPGKKKESTSTPGVNKVGFEYDWDKTTKS